MNLRIGVIGAGKWGQNHVRIFSELGKLSGISDQNPEAKSIADGYNVSFETDYKKLLQTVDAVSVAVPTDRHYEVVKDCILAGKHVLVEKPMTMDSTQAKELIELAKEKNLVLAGGYLFRFNAAAIELKKQLKNLGDIQYITARYIHSNKPPRKDSGVIFNFAIHLIDVLNFVLERKPNNIFCKKLNYLSKDREDCAFIILDYGDFVANLEVSWFHPLKKRNMWIIGSDEKIYADLFEQIIIRYPIKIDNDKTVADKEINVEVHKNEPLKTELKDFCKRIEDNMDGESVDINEEHVTIELCEKCIESAKIGNVVEV
jgi:UDP-N-acetylglucosamine 3-dehydrogenase